MSTRTSTYLIADTRERHVLPFTHEITEGPVHVRQINTGDYLICQRSAGGEPVVRACIERKTHADFAASIKDGRYGNVEKMLELRQKQPGCQLFYFIEGPAFIDRNRAIGHIPYRVILHAITMLAIRDSVFIVHTEDERDTARRLNDFMRGYAETDPEWGTRAVAADASDAADASAADNFAPAGAAAAVLPPGLTGRIEQPDVSIVISMWAQLRGISAILGAIIAPQWSIADLVCGRVPPAAITDLKTASGRSANADARATLKQLAAGNHAMACRVLSGIPTITLETAAAILTAAGGIAAVCGMSAAALAKIPLKQKTRVVTVGPKKAARILALLHWCGPTGPAAAAIPAAAATPAATAAVIPVVPAPTTPTVTAQEILDAEAGLLAILNLGI